MGHCVRLIRALVCQPQPELTEEERQKLWVDFKTKAKHEGWKLSETAAWDVPYPQQSKTIADDNNCDESGSNCLTIGPVRVKFEDDSTLTGTATLTHADGTTEDGQVVHLHYDPIAIGSASNSVETTILTPTKQIHLRSGKCTTSNPLNCFKGTSITTAPDGTQKLAAVRIVSFSP